MNLEPRELTAFLNTRRVELTDRLARLERDAQRVTEPLVGDFADQAVQRQNDDVVDRLRETTAAELREVATTLSKLENGTYGECARCGSTIEPARLQALPYSPFCLSCADRRTATRRPTVTK